MSNAQSEINIGTLGHVDHGKTTLTRAITGVWTDKHSESIKRSMTIKLGYADAVIKKCEGCKGPSAYTTGDKCSCAEGKKPEPIRRISLLDAPGHETLMATAIAGSNIIDAVLFVISATEPCPMPQTKEHLMIIQTLGLSNVIVVQTKIDIIGKKKAKEHYDQIRKFLKGSVAENAPIIPVIANKDINVDAVLEQIAMLKVPERDEEADPLMYVARSFDVNKPGTSISKIVGGVIGGSIIKGKFKVGDEIEIRPGMNSSKGKKNSDQYKPIITKVEALSAGSGDIEEAHPGGLIAIRTSMDPTFSKADSLVGNFVGKVGKLPKASSSLQINYIAINRDDIPKQGFRDNEPLILGIGTATTVGYIKAMKKDKLSLELKRQVCVEKGAKVSVLRNIGQRWRLTGYAEIMQV